MGHFTNVQCDTFCHFARLVILLEFVILSKAKNLIIKANNLKINSGSAILRSRFCRFNNITLCHSEQSEESFCTQCVKSIFCNVAVRAMNCIISGVGIPKTTFTYLFPLRNCTFKSYTCKFSTGPECTITDISNAVWNSYACK